MFTNSSSYCGCRLYTTLITKKYQLASFATSIAEQLVKDKFCIFYAQACKYILIFIFGKAWVQLRASRLLVCCSVSAIRLRRKFRFTSPRKTVTA